MATDDRDLDLGGVLLAGVFLGESLGTDNIQGGDTEETLGIEGASGFEDLSGNRDGRVNGVGDNQDESLGAEFGNTLNQVPDDTSVDLEQVVTGHTRLAYNVHSKSQRKPRLRQTIEPVSGEEN